MARGAARRMPAQHRLPEGFLWDTLWNLPDNTDLRDARQDPGLLLVGDRIMIPERRIKTVPAGRMPTTVSSSGACPPNSAWWSNTKTFRSPTRTIPWRWTVPFDRVEHRRGRAPEGRNTARTLRKGCWRSTACGSNCSWARSIRAVRTSAFSSGFRGGGATYHGKLDGEIGPVTLDAVATSRRAPVFPSPASSTTTR